MRSRLLLRATLALAAPVVAFGQIKLNEHFSVSGYVAASAVRAEQRPGGVTTREDVDAAKLLFSAEYQPVGAVLSYFYIPEAPGKARLLDAYVSVALGERATLRAGKFLSYLGYESFDLPDMNQISYANGDFLASIPGYHTGVKWDYAADAIGAGLAVIDSVYSGPNYLKGDGELRHNAGVEGFFSYKPIPSLTLWGGFGFESAGNVVSKNDTITVLDLWASYALTAETTLAAEVTRKDGVAGGEGFNWLAACTRTLGTHWSGTLRISGERMDDGGPAFTKFTVSPAYKFSPHASLRAEWSHFEARNHPLGVERATLLAVQAIVRF